MVWGRGKLHKIDELPPEIQKEVKRLNRRKTRRMRKSLAAGVAGATGGSMSHLSCKTSVSESVMLGAGMGAMGAVAGYRAGDPAVIDAHNNLEAILTNPEYNEFISTLEKPYLVHTKRGLVETDYVPRRGKIRVLANEDKAKKNPKLYNRYVDNRWYRAEESSQFISPKLLPKKIKAKKKPKRHK